MGNLEIITVNYNTPDLIERLVNSIREHEGMHHITVIDGSDKDHLLNIEARELTVHTMGWNIHHGRGLDFALNTVHADYALIIDSDNYIKKPIIDKMLALMETGWYIVGHYCHTDRLGNSIERSYSKYFPIQYWHPSFMMINVLFYRHLSKYGVKFIHHGAPAISIAKHLHKNKLDVAVDIGEMIEHDINDYVFMEGEGTVKRFGYNL